MKCADRPELQGKCNAQRKAIVASAPNATRTRSILPRWTIIDLACGLSASTFIASKPRRLLPDADRGSGAREGGSHSQGKQSGQHLEL